MHNFPNHKIYSEDELLQDIFEVSFEIFIQETYKLIKNNNSKKPAIKCFISYAWGDLNVQEQLKKLSHYLTKLKIITYLDVGNSKNTFIRSNPPGTSIDQFIQQINTADIILVAITKDLIDKYNASKNNLSKHIIYYEIFQIIELIKSRHNNKKIIPIYFEDFKEIKKSYMQQQPILFR